MPTLANLSLVLMGLLPVIISMVKVEKYFTSFYTGLWNLYGTILVIIGYITDFDVPTHIFIFGVLSILFIIFIIIFSYDKNRPDLIRYIGKSCFTVTYTIFFTILFFCQEIIFSISISVFTAILMILISKLIEMRNYEMYISKKYLREGYLPPKNSLYKITKSQENYYYLRIILFAYPFFNLILNGSILYKYLYYNKSLLISIFFLLILTFSPFYLIQYKCNSIFSKDIINQLRWFIKFGYM